MKLESEASVHPAPGVVVVSGSYAVSKKRNDVWETHCDIQKPLCRPLFEMLLDAQLKLACHGLFEIENEENSCDYARRNVAVLRLELNKQCTPSVVMYAFLLFERLRATFEEGDKQMHEWFFNLPPIQIGKILHELSNLAKSMARKYGVLSVMFAMCLHFAMVQLEDNAPFRSNFFTDLVFCVEFGEGIQTQRERKHDFILLQRATLIQLNWATHVSVKDYKEGVQALEEIAQEKKEKILNMFDDQEQTHAELMVEEPGGDDVARSRLRQKVCISQCEVCHRAARRTPALKEATAHTAHAALTAPAALAAPDALTAP